MKRLFTFLLLSLIFMPSGFSQKFDWIIQSKASGNNYLRGFVELDEYIYVVGRHRGASEYGYDTNMISNPNHYGSRDLVILKVEKETGDIENYAHLGTVNSESGFEIGSNGSDLFVYGRFEDSLGIHGQNILSQGSDDIYVAKFDTTLNCKWIRGFGGPGFDREGDFIVSNNDVYMSLSYADRKLYWASDSLIGGSVAVFKIDTSGEVSWGLSNEMVSANATASFLSLEYIQNDSSLLFAGSLARHHKFGGVQLNAVNNQWGDMLYGKVNANGTFGEVNFLGGNYPEKFSKTVRLENGDTYFGGSFGGSSNIFNDTVITYSSFSSSPDAGSKRNAFVSKYSEENNESMIFQLMSTKYSDIHDIKVDGNGILWALASFSDSLILDDTTWVSEGDADCLLFSLDHNHELRSIRKFGGPGTWDGGSGGDKGHQIHIDSLNQIFISAQFVGNFNEDSLVVSHRLPRAYYGILSKLEQEPRASDFIASDTVGCKDSVIQFVAPYYSANEKYTWSFEGGNPSSSTNRIENVVYSNSGNWNVKLKVESVNGIDSINKTNYIAIKEDCTLGHEESLTRAEDHFIIFPNPTTGLLNLKNINTIEGKLRVFDVYGRVILLKELNQQPELIINLRNNELGVFFIQILDENSKTMYIKKIVLEQ